MCKFSGICLRTVGNSKLSHNTFFYPLLINENKFFDKYYVEKCVRIYQSLVAVNNMTSECH